MPRGGARPGSGPKSTWNLGKTTSIRVPEVLASTLLRIARSIDNNSSVESILTDEEIEKNLNEISNRLLAKLVEALAKEFDQ